MVGYDSREEFRRQIGLCRFHDEGTSVSTQHVLEFGLAMKELRGAGGGQERVSFEHADAVGDGPEEYQSKDSSSGPPDQRG
jgi:hypothetical protein